MLVFLVMAKKPNVSGIRSDDMEIFGYIIP